MTFNHTFESAQSVIDFVNERHAITLRKALKLGETLPAWANPMRVTSMKSLPGDVLTEDPILRQFRFCSVFRELDRVTVWIRENIREPFADHEHLWFMLAIARFVNWPPTLAELFDATGNGAWPSHGNFSPEGLGRALEARRARGNKVETGAYMIRAESDPKKEWYSWSKQRYVAEIVLGRPWAERENIAYMLETEGTTLKRAWEWFSGKHHKRFVGWGPFMAGQVVADLRHTRYLRAAPDVGKWAPVGPGSARGLNRLAGRPLKQAVSQEQGLDEMLQLQELVNKATGPWVPQIELHDIQNCLCETDKYLRVKSGEGRPRAQYTAGRGY